MALAKSLSVPPKIKKALTALVDDICVQENVLGVGLYGSWARGDATPLSDVDLLVLDRRELKYEILDRVESDGLIFDLQYIPKRWLTNRIPPKIDQMLHELKILYDPNMLLSDIKKWITDNYEDPHRVSMRCEAHIIDSTIILSRAKSAFERRDYRSTAASVSKAVDHAYKILLEVTFTPISLSSFVNDVQRTCRGLKMGTYYTDYLRAHRIDTISKERIENDLSLFISGLEDLSSFLEKHKETIERLHEKQRTALRYYSGEELRKGTAGRLRSIIDAGNYAEAEHYIRDVLLDVLDNAIWAVGTTTEIKADQSIIFNFLKRVGALEGLQSSTLKIFDLEELKGEDAEGLLNLAIKLTSDIKTKKAGFIEKIARASSR